MDRDPGNSERLFNDLRRTVDAILIDVDGLICDDREFVPTKDLALELDVTDVIVTRRDGYERTVCHVHHLPTEDQYWRHTTYILWDDGHTGVKHVSLDLFDDEKEKQARVKEVARAWQEQANALVEKGVISRTKMTELVALIAEETHRLMHILENTSMLRDEIGESLSLVDIDEIVTERVAAVAKVIPELEEEARNFFKAFADVQLVKNNLTERQIMAHAQMLAVSNEDDLPPIEPYQAWELIELLDKVQQI